MSVYFVVDTYINSEKDITEYENYIRLVKPIVESYGGKYLARTNDITHLSEKRTPNREIIIEFKSKSDISNWLSSAEYKKIMSKRESTVDSRAIIVEGLVWKLVTIFIK